MSLGRLRAAARLRASRRFVAREAEQAHFVAALQAYLSGSEPFKVINYYGVGGIGKTALLKRLYALALERSGLRIAFVDLEAPQFAATYDFVLEIWRQLRWACPLFEYALARVLALEGRLLKDIRRGPLHHDSLLYDLQEVALGAADVVAPGRLLKKLFDMADESRRRYLTALKDDFAHIDSQDNAELLAQLPQYLGAELGAYAKDRAAPFAVFLDTTDALSAKPHLRSTKSDASSWMLELVGAAETGLFVVSGRTSLDWALSDVSWNRYLDCRWVGELPAEDANRFLLQIPIDDPEVRRAIIESSRGVPLYLDLCASTYVGRKHDGETLSADDFRTNEMEVVRRFLGHLDREHQEALRATACLQLFDRQLFAEIVRGLNIHLPLSLFAEFCRTSYAMPVAATSGLFKIHDVICEYLRREADEELRSQILSAAVKQMARSCAERQLERTAWLLGECYKLIERRQVTCGEDDATLLVDSGVLLIEEGRWNTVYSALVSSSSHSEDDRISDRLVAGSVMLRGYSLRKRGQLSAAMHDYERLTSISAILGRHERLYQYLHAQTRQLLGEYEKAATVYEAIIEAETRSPEDRHVRGLAYRQLADIRMLQGRFFDATAMLGLVEREGEREAPLWRAEIARFRGHVFRFNFALRSAEEMYERALQDAVVGAGEAMEGKALTNLAEVACWSEPRRAIELAARAIERNREVTAPIEVGKAMAARGIALALDGSFGEADAAIAVALRTHAGCGYRAGGILGLQARGILQVLVGDLDGAKNTVATMTSMADEMGVYRYVTYVLWWLMFAERDIDDWSNRCQWLDFAATNRSLSALFKERLPKRSGY